MAANIVSLPLPDPELRERALALAEASSLERDIFKADVSGPKRTGRAAMYARGVDEHRQVALAAIRRLAPFGTVLLVTPSCVIPM